MTRAPTQTVEVRGATTGDEVALVAIYNHYIAESVITFEEEPLAAAEMGRRMDAARAADWPWLVATADGAVAGYAYAGPWKARSAYRRSAEVTVYVAVDRPRRGVGSALYRRLLEVLEGRGLHTLIAGIALPNEASVALHERFGFRKVAHFEEVGFKQGRFIDVGYWQRHL